jgi:ArsR family transcriptional regulator
MKPACCIDKKSPAEVVKTAEFLKIIADENRLKILCILQNGQKCVCDIWQCLNLPQNLTSHHLKVLKDFGLLFSKKQGLKVFYKPNQQILKKSLQLLNKLLSKKAKV